MTIGSQPHPDQYNGDGSTIVFTINFKYFKKSHIRVVHADAIGVETVWTEGTQYTLSDPGSETGTLTVKTTPTDYTPQTGETLTIKLDVPYLQEKNFPEAGPFPTSEVEQAFDLLTQVASQLLEAADRTLKAPESEAGTTFALPTVDNRKNKHLAFDGDGKPAAGVDITSLVATKYLDTFAGDGSTIEFTLTAAPTSAAALSVYLDGVRQTVATDYTLLGTTLTFSTAPHDGAVCLAAHEDTFAGVPTDGSVTTTKLAENAVTFEKIANKTLGDLFAFGASGAPTVIAAGALRKPLIGQGASLPTFGEPVPCISKAPPEMKNDAGDLAHDIEFQIGECRAENAYELLKLSAVMTKQIDASWAAGDDAGGLFSGTVGNNTWYHCFLIRKDSDGTTDGGFDTSISAANIPAGYTAYRRIGSVKTDGSANIIAFTQVGDWFQWDDPPRDLSSSTIGLAASLHAVNVPTGLKIVARLHLRANSAQGVNILVSSPERLDELPVASFGSNDPPPTISSALEFVPVQDVLTDTSARVRARSDTANSDLDIFAIGWADRRGRDG